MQKKTTQEKKENGTYRPGRDGIGDPPLGVFGRPDVPASLTKDQKAIFNFVCERMEEAKWLRESDGPTLHAFSILQDRLNKKPDEFTAAEFTQFRLLANELGLSPAARAKMPKIQQEKPKSGFDDL